MPGNFKVNMDGSRRTNNGENEGKGEKERGEEEEEQHKSKLFVMVPAIASHSSRQNHIPRVKVNLNGIIDRVELFEPRAVYISFSKKERKKESQQFLHS